MTFSTNHPILFVIAGIIIAVVLAQSIFFLVMAWKRGIAIGISCLGSAIGVSNKKKKPRRR